MRGLISLEQEAESKPEVGLLGPRNRSGPLADEGAGPARSGRGNTPESLLKEIQEGTARSVSENGRI